MPPIPPSSPPSSSTSSPARRAGRAGPRGAHAAAADRRASPCPEGPAGRCYVPPEPRTEEGPAMATATQQLQNFIDGELVDAAEGAHRARPQPGDRAGDRRRRPTRPARRTSTAPSPPPARAFETWSHDHARPSARTRCSSSPTRSRSTATSSPSSSRPTPASRSRPSRTTRSAHGRQPALLRRRGAQHGGQGRRRVPRGLHVDGSGARRSASSARSRPGTTR